MRIHNPFQFGLLAGLGALLAVLIGMSLQSLATILTYVGAALFLALGLDPLVSWLESRGVKRWLAVVIVVLAVLGVVTGVLYAVIPVIVSQATLIVTTLVRYVNSLTFQEFVTEVQTWIGPVVDVQSLVDEATVYLTSNASDIGAMISDLGSGLLSVGIGIANGLFGTLIVVILMIYFIASLTSIKSGLYQLVPASKRERFIDLAEQISKAVGRYVVGQVTLAFCNGLLSLIFLSIIGARYSVLLATVAFLFSLVPLVGTISGSTVIVLLVLVFDGWPTVLAAAIYYLIYMQVEAYLLSPNIMNRAVRVPGVVVVIAALAGGTLLGILGALVAIPVAASVLIVVKQVFIPRQQLL